MEFFKSCVSVFRRIMDKLLPRKPTDIPLLFGIEIECFAARKFDVDQASDIREYMKAEFAVWGLDANVEDLADISQTYQYTKWFLTEDNSLDSDRARDDVMVKAVPYIKPADKDRYNTFGLELVSPPMAVPTVQSSTPPHEQEQLKAIGEYLAVLKGPLEDDGRHHSFVTEQCGLHVHLGLPDDELIPLIVLQHLCFILILYETTINSLHHHSRTPMADTQAGRYADSNRKAFLGDSHTCPSKCSFDIADAKSKIFATQTVHELAYLMGCAHKAEARYLTNLGGHLSPAPQHASENAWLVPTRTVDASELEWSEQTGIPEGVKYKIVRFNLLTRPDGAGARTVEFRQAAGTLDHEEVSYNVQLDVALVRAAERRANSPHEESEEPVPSLQGLLVDVLQLPNHAVEYWVARADKLAEGRTLARRDPEHLKDSETCSACATELEDMIRVLEERVRLERFWRLCLPKGKRRAAPRKLRAEARRKSRLYVRALATRQQQEAAGTWARDNARAGELDAQFAAGGDGWSQQVRDGLDDWADERAGAVSDSISDTQEDGW